MYCKRTFLFSFLIFVITCSKDKGITDSGYPPEIAKIIVKKCATSGCHTLSSKESAGGLSLETWDQLFAGSRNGAACIPYNHQYSTLFLFTNTYSDLGVTNTPTMPYNKPALSKEEIITLMNWIDAGAPNSAGKVAFSGNPNRKKVYVTNQGCDVVTVFDAATQLQMRYIDVGVTGAIESPHMVKVSPDGNYWYVVFNDTASHVQKFRTSDDTKVGELDMSPGNWSTFSISNDSKSGFAIDWNPDGRIAHIDLKSMTLLGGSPWSGFWDAHGSAVNPEGDTLLVTARFGNYIHKVPVNNPVAFIEVVLDPPSSPSSTSLFDPHEVVFSPDSLYYYLTCVKSNEVRVMRVMDDALIAAIPTGKFPQGMSFSKTTPYLFVTCEKEFSAPDTTGGSVDVINYATNTWVKRLSTNMSEPNGIAVDDANGLVYVANRNRSLGFHPHHKNACGGNNGFVSFIDLHTLEVIQDMKIEVATDPYSIAVRK
ncbi:MAG: hypothetical protein EPN85_08735 [Bacteroidetes bacterium]|nr:MAG: hypothetical protein EPN85_08735 [Bacteroidota bacterium]